MSKKFLSVLGIEDIKVLGSFAEQLFSHTYHLIAELEKKYIKNVHRQDDTTNTENKTFQVIRKGWGSITGNNTINISETVTTGITYSDTPIIIVTSLGTAASAPTAIGDFITAPANAWVCVARSITTTTFVVDMYAEVGTTFVNTKYFGYTWIAIGTKN